MGVCGIDDDLIHDGARHERFEHPGQMWCIDPVGLQEEEGEMASPWHKTVGTKMATKVSDVGKRKK